MLIYVTITYVKCVYYIYKYIYSIYEYDLEAGDQANSFIWIIVKCCIDCVLLKEKKRWTSNLDWVYFFG